MDYNNIEDDVEFVKKVSTYLYECTEGEIIGLSDKETKKLVKLILPAEIDDILNKEQVDRFEILFVEKWNKENNEGEVI